MLSVIIPALNEEPWLNRTIDNIFTTCSSERDLEVIIIDQGGNGDIDKRARVISPGENVGERKAMNLAADMAIGEWLMRIDAHCDFSPQNWDIMLCNVTGEKDITVAVLTATDKQWNRLPGHWYGLCRLIKTAKCDYCSASVPVVNEVLSLHTKTSTGAEGVEDLPCPGSHTKNCGPIGLEAKWQKPNRDHTTYETVEPNMSLTGCGFVIRKDFYWDIGGADESLPKMGAIGEEFGIKAYLAGGKVQTRTDCMVGHIFGTGGYDTSGVKVAQQMLWDMYGDRYQEIADKFPNFEGVRLIKTDQPGPDVRTVTVLRVDTQDTKDPQTDKLIRRREERFKYIWVENEHTSEKHLTDKEIEVKYAPKAAKVGETIYVVDERGTLIELKEE